jgi:16S rRNA (uracil1498-N3)-methyltransferase
MRNLFLPGVDLSRATIVVEGADAHHLVNVLRVKCGDQVTILDNRGGAVEAEIAEVAKRSLTARVVGPAQTAPEPAISITVYQALGKGDKFEQVIQHGTEAGASAFAPLLTERSISRISAEDAAAKQPRWELIAKGAAEQSGRARIPRIGNLATIASIVGELEDEVYERLFVLDSAGEALSVALQRPLPLAFSAVRPPEFAVAVGPEGGFSPAEVDRLIGAGGECVSLGEHVLRTETAALIAIAQILFAKSLGLPPEPAS